LSAIERLAKCPTPAFIVVFLCGDSGDVIAGHLIHLIDANLERVLERLRQAHVNKGWDINRVTITFNFRQCGKRFDIAPGSFKEAVSTACGSDALQYVRDKQNQLENLGYDYGRFQLEALTWIESPQHLSNMLLGLMPLEPEQLKVFEVRFGIPVLREQTEAGQCAQLWIEPPSIGDCKVIVRGAGMSKPAIFVAQAFVGPPIAAIDGPQILIKHSDLQLRLTRDRLEFATTGNFYTEKRTTARWIELLRGLLHLSKGGATVTLQDLPRLPALSLTLEAAIEGPSVGDLPRLLALMEGWQELAALAGVIVSGDFCIEELGEAPEVILAVDALLYSGAHTNLEFDNVPGLEDSTEVEAIHFNTARLGGTLITYATKIRFKRGGLSESVWAAVSNNILDARSHEGDLQKYGRDLAMAHNLRVILDPAQLAMVNPKH
jgi:hypothetical protein